MRAAIAAVAVLVAVAAGGGAAATSSCATARVEYGRYPGGDRRLDMLPWVRGEGQGGLVGLIWYWPAEWSARHVREARIFTRGQALAGRYPKILWAFTAPAARYRGGREAVLEGLRLDGPGRFVQRFVSIKYAGQRGAPSFASIPVVPRPGCWRLRLTTDGLRASVVLRAVESPR